MHDEHRQPAQVLQHQHPQGDRNRPEFTEGERLYALIRFDKEGQQAGVEATVSMGNQRPSDPVDSRIAGKKTIGQLGQFAVIAFGQVDTDVVYLLFDDVVVVEQPFRRRGDGPPFGRRLRDRGMGRQ